MNEKANVEIYQRKSGKGKKVNNSCYPMSKYDD